MVTRSTPVASASDHPQWRDFSPSRPAIVYQPLTSRSCSWFHWSCAGRACSSQYHWQMAASTSAGGVSARYSSSFGGDRPSYQRSRQPYRLGAPLASDRRTAGAAQSGMPNSAHRALVTTCRAAATHSPCSSSVAASSARTSDRVST